MADKIGTDEYAVESLLQRVFKTAGRALLSIDTDSADVLWLLEVRC